MSKTLDEDLFDYYRIEGYNSGLEDGKQLTFVDCVRALMASRNLDIDSAMDALNIPKDLRKEIRDSI